MTASKSPITTHVLDVSRGRPAGGLTVILEASGGNGAWREVGRGATNNDGRVMDLLPQGAAFAAGVYRLTFDTAAYFKAVGVAGFYPQVTISFEIKNPGEHYHVPLLLSPFGYSTYRGN
jgi:5-hydroxyisourate hydrolase